MGTKDCGRWALYGTSELAGVSAGALNSDGSELG